jgi:cysteine desulfurase/selenocysteine lyase
MLDTKKIRQNFPILKRKINGKPLVYLDNAATSQKPKQVIEAVADYYEQHNANVARGVHTLANEATQLYEKARMRVADFIGAEKEEVVWVRNATEAINLVAFSWGLNKLQKNEVIVTSVLEHHSNLLPWRMVAERTGAKLRYVDIDDQGRLLMRGRSRTKIPGVVVGSLEKVLDDRVRLVAVAAKSNMTGALQPVGEVVKMVRSRSERAVVVLDGSQSVPHIKTNVKKLGVDFLAFSGHKMLGPMGIGVLWGKRQKLEEMPPFLRGGDMISEVTLMNQKWNVVPHKFEAGTPNVAGAVGLAAAIDYLEKVGMERIHEHEVELTEYLLNKLKAPRKVRQVGPRGKQNQKLKIEMYGPEEAKDRAGVVSFNVHGVHAHDVAQILDSEGVAVRSGQHCTGPLLERLGIPASVRVSFYLYNTKEEVDRLIEGLKKVIEVFKI